MSDAFWIAAIGLAALLAIIVFLIVYVKNNKLARLSLRGLGLRLDLSGALSVEQGRETGRASPRVVRPGTNIYDLTERIKNLERRSVGPKLTLMEKSPVTEIPLELVEKAVHYADAKEELRLIYSNMQGGEWPVPDQAASPLTKDQL